MEVEFVGQSARDRDNIAAAPSRLVNCYAEPHAEGGRVLKSVLGMQPKAQMTGVFVRALETIAGQIYAACDGRLWRIDADGTAGNLGATDDGETTLSGNNGVIAVTANGKYFTYASGTVTERTPLWDVGSACFISNYTVLSQLGGRQFQWSDVADATDLPALNFTTADGRDDNIVRVTEVSGTLVVMKEQSHELWYVTGQAGANAFARASGGVRDIGLAGFDLFTKILGGAFLVGSDARAHIATAGGIQPVSIPPVETAIKQCRPQYCFTYEDEGHTFCVITFRDCAAWVYDVATKEWHERASGVNLGPWLASCAAKMGGEWYVGRDGGGVDLMARTNSDGDTPLVREAISRALQQDGQRMIIREVELFPRQGFSSGAITLFISRDGGVTWGNARHHTIGPVGKYGQRVIWRHMGQARRWAFKIRWTDAADVTLSTKARIA
jgi:hypothetical protein